MTSMANPLDLMQVDQVIRDAARFQDVLDSPVCGVLVRMVEQQHYAEFKQAKDDEARRMAQAKAHVMDDVMTALRQVIAAGERDALERERKARSAEASRPHSQES